LSLVPVFSALKSTYTLLTWLDLQLKVLDVPNIMYEEECWIDTKKRFAQLKSKPLGYQNYAVMTESSTFSQASENPNWYNEKIFIF
jgi:hypothetical protein